METVSERSKLLSPPPSDVTRLRISSDSAAINHLDVSKVQSDFKLPEQRLRTNSVTIFRDRESVVSTSYGPVLVSEPLCTSYGPVLVSEPMSAGNIGLGFFLATLSGVLFTVNNFLFQYLGLNVTEVLLTRSGLQAALLMILLSATCSPILPKGGLDCVLVVLQGLAAAVRVGLTFACLDHLPLGDALTIIFTEPLWTLLLAKLFLGTRVGWWKTIFGMVLIAGVVLCTQPPGIFSSGVEKKHQEVTRGSYFFGVLLAVLSATTGAASNVIIAGCREVSSLVLVFHSGLGGCLVALLYSAVDTEDRINGLVVEVPGHDWLWLGILGVMGLSGYYALTRSLQLIPPTTVAVLRAMEIVLAYLIQGIVTGVVPNMMTVTGSSLVIISVVATAVEDTCIGRCWRG